MNVAFNDTTQSLEIVHEAPNSPWSKAITNWQAFEAEHGPYSDYVAWELWINKQECFDDLGGGELLTILQDADYRAPIALYSIMWAALKGW